MAYPHAGLPEDRQHDPDKNFILQEGMEDVSSGVPQLKDSFYSKVIIMITLVIC